MLRLKQYIKIISLFALLFVVVSVPAFFMEHQRNLSFNKTVFYPVDAVQFGDNNDSHGNDPHEQDYSIWDRIKLIGGANVAIQSVEYTDFEANANLRESLLPLVEEQLSLLQSFGALPDLSFSDVVSTLFTKITYADVVPTTEEYANISNAESLIHIWEVQIEYRDFHVLAYMDTYNSVLYDITILSESNSFLYSSSISENGFLEYLQQFSNEPNEGDNVFTAGGYYTERMIRLYPVLLNTQTRQMSPYRIGNS